jgi:hypothetical protein
MKKILFLFAILFVFSFTNKTYAQLLDEKNVTFTMDLQPILQLNMTTPDQIDFVFDKIRDYYSGVIKYGATVLKVSASVSWDLYAVGTSQNAAGNYWDQQLEYGTMGTVNRVSNIPLSALELHQYPANAYHALAGASFDYSTPFTDVSAVVTPGQNSIYESPLPYVAPALTEKYLQGDKGISAGPADGAPGGSYLTAVVNPATGMTDFYFIIDYRIVPGLPAVFPFAGTNAFVSEAIPAGSYASPGVYTMDVKYVILEDQ